MNKIAKERNKTQDGATLADKVNVGMTGLHLRVIPIKRRTPELCESAVKNDERVLQYVPAELRTDIGVKIKGDKK